MKHQLYFPSRQSAQLQWLTHFRHTLPGHAETLRIQPQSLATTLRDLDWLIYVMTTVLVQVRNHSKACTSALNLLMSGAPNKTLVLPVLTPQPPPEGEMPPLGALKRVFKQIRGIKASPGFNDAIGLSLGIMGNLHAKDSPVPKFKLKVTRAAHTEVVEGTFSRFGHTGVFVQTKRGGGDWEKLQMGIFGGSSFLDERPMLDPAKPEVREYRLCFWDDESPNGNWTPVKHVTVSP